MNDGIYRKAYRADERRKVIYIAISAIITLAVVLFALFDVYTHTIGAPAIKSAADVKNYESGTTAQIKSNKVYYTGYYYTKNGKVVAYYYFVEIDGYYFVIRSKKEYTSKELKLMHTYSGELHRDPYAKDNQGILMDMSDFTEDEVKEYLLPVELSDEDNFESLPYLFIAILPLLFLLIFVSGMSKNRKNVKRLAQIMDVEDAERSLERQLDKSVQANCGNLTVTPGWIFSRKGDVFLLPAKELIWLYKGVTTTKTYGVTTGKTYKIIMWFKDGRMIETVGSQSSVDNMIAFIIAQCPRPIIGYSKELRKTMKKNRNEFIENCNRIRTEQMQEKRINHELSERGGAGFQSQPETGDLMPEGEALGGSGDDLG